MSRLLSITALWLLLLFAAVPASAVMNVQPRNGTWEIEAGGYEPVLDVRDGPNLYAYVKQNPWTKFDPDGLATFEGDPMMSSRSWVSDNGYINITAGADGYHSTVPNALHASSLELKVNQGTSSLQGLAKTRYLNSTKNDSELSRGLAWRWAQNPDDMLVNVFLGMSSVGGADKGEGMRVKVPMRSETPSSGRKSMWLDRSGGAAGESPSTGAKKQIVVNEATIKEALKDSPMQTTQGRVSQPMVERYVRKLEAGETAPEISVDGNVIVDGNHRYVAGRLFGKEPAVKAGTLSESQRDKIKPMKDTTVDSVDWDPPKKK